MNKNQNDIERDILDIKRRVSVLEFDRGVLLLLMIVFAVISW
jgi:hypothetical protein